MRRFIIPLLITTATCLTAQDFRKNEWGDSLANVLNKETSELISQSETTLAYTDSILGLEAWCIYQFMSKQLVSGIYRITEGRSNSLNYISDFENLKSALTKKYGEPAKAGSHWSQTLSKNDPESWGTALILGHVTFYSEWITKTTKIQLGLSGENMKAENVIIYTSLESIQDIQSAREKENLDKL